MIFLFTLYTLFFYNIFKHDYGNYYTDNRIGTKVVTLVSRFPTGSDTTDWHANIFCPTRALVTIAITSYNCLPDPVRLSNTDPVTTRVDILLYILHICIRDSLYIFCLHLRHLSLTTYTHDCAQ